MSKDNDEKFGDAEAQERFKAALRGARITGHKSIRDISPKRKVKPKWKKSAKGG